MNAVTTVTPSIPPSAQATLTDPRFAVQLFEGLTGCQPLNLNHFVLNASGTFYAEGFHKLFPLPSAMGGMVTKTVTEEVRAGNPQNRTAEISGYGMLNSIGLQNPGLQETLETVLPEYHTYGVPVILSISAHSIAGFERMVTTIANHPSRQYIAALELNLSCPNVDEGGVHFGVSAPMVQGVCERVRVLSDLPFFAKLTPNVSDIVAIGEAAVQGGAYGLTAINTLLGASIDIHRRKPFLDRVSGGYSGPALKPVALHAVWNLRQRLPETPIMGVGGICTADDVLAFLMAGATLVQIGTACYQNPMVFKTVLEELTAYADANSVRSFQQELVGCAHPVRYAQ